MSQRNIDAAELGKFEELAEKWWDTESDFKPLHAINPLRVSYITNRVSLSGKRVLDVGCGGGILSEAMVKQGATVFGIDAARASIACARRALPPPPSLSRPVEGTRARA